MKSAALAACVLLAGQAPAPDAMPPVSGEFVRLFTAYCLQGFPDDAAISGRAAREQLKPVEPAQAKVLLRGKRGAAWLIAASDGEYAMTLQPPPAHTCTIHRRSAQLLDGAPLAAAARDFTKASGHDLLAPVASSLPTPDGGTSDALVLQEVDGKGVSINAAYMFITVSHPGGLGPDGAFVKAWYDVRFVRQIFRTEI